MDVHAGVREPQLSAGGEFIKVNQALDLKTLKTTAINQSGFTIIIYPSYFKLHVRWPRSFTPVTYRSKLLGIHSFAALLGLRPRPFGASASAVQKRQASLSCNSDYLGYRNHKNHSDH